MIDLHTHSTHSDGSYTPGELVRYASKRKISIIALTDHDTVSGIDEAIQVGRETGVEIIPGIEVSVTHEPGTMHILGYFLNYQDSIFQNRLEKLQSARESRNIQLIQMLNDLGIKITLEEVAKEAGGGQIGRPHFASALIKKGIVKNFDEAFRNFLAKGAAAYVDKRYLSSTEAIRLIHEAGGLAVLAHPKLLGFKSDAELEACIQRLSEEGLDGLEVFCSSQSGKESERYREVALRYDLFITGGSDFHGAKKASVELGILGTYGRMDDSIVKEMRAYLEAAKDGVVSNAT